MKGKGPVPGSPGALRVFLFPSELQAPRVLLVLTPEVPPETLEGQVARGVGDVPVVTPDRGESPPLLAMQGGEEPNPCPDLWPVACLKRRVHGGNHPGDRESKGDGLTG